MKIKIEELREVFVGMEVEFPYYFRVDMSMEGVENIMYGKISQKDIAIIHEMANDEGETQYEITKGDFNPHIPIVDPISSFFDKRNKSTVQEFDEAHGRAIEFVKNL